MQKGFAHLLLIAILAIAVLSAFGVYFFIFKNQPSQNIQDKIVPPAPPTKEEIKQNNTYNNETLGIMFPLPEGFTVKEETEAEFHKRSNGEMRKNFTGYVHYAPPEFAGSLYALDKNNDYEHSPLSVWVFENPDNLTPQNFYKNYWYYPFIWGDYSSSDKNKIAPNTKFMLGQDEATGAAVLDRDPKAKFIYLSKGSKMYLLKVVGDSINLADLQFLN